MPCGDCVRGNRHNIIRGNRHNIKGINKMNIIFAKHSGSKEYVFSVPDNMAHRIKKGDILLVDTMRGDSIAIATTGVISGAGAIDIAKRSGAYQPLKRVITYANEAMQNWIVQNNDLNNELPF